jgi:hypothetical protein
VSKARTIEWEKESPYDTVIPFWDQCVTLGRVENGEITFATSKTGKVELLATARADIDNGVTFFAVWTGQWRSDVFAVTAEDIMRAKLLR